MEDMQHEDVRSTLTEEEQAEYEAIAFVGNALAPFFLQDPQKGTAQESFAAFQALDVQAAAAEWPFGETDQVQRGLQDMVAGLADGITEDLTWEYRRLFVGPGPKAAAPWGSVYTDRDGVIFGKSTLDLRAWMREHGIERLVSEGDPEDHLGLLLSLMAWIALNKPQMLDEFLTQHVLTWSNHFLDLMQDATQHSFYRGLAVLTQASLQGIQSQRALQVEYPRFYR